MDTIHFAIIEYNDPIQSVILNNIINKTERTLRRIDHNECIIFSISIIENGTLNSLPRQTCKFTTEYPGVSHKTMCICATMKLII